MIKSNEEIADLMMNWRKTTLIKIQNKETLTRILSIHTASILTGVMEIYNWSSNSSEFNKRIDSLASKLGIPPLDIY